MLEVLQGSPGAQVEEVVELGHGESGPPQVEVVELEPGQGL